MRFAGIDIGSERHAVAIVDERGEILKKSVPISEDAAGYRRLRALLGEPGDCLVAMEATGHYFALSSALIGRVEVPPALG
jgi:transposase